MLPRSVLALVVDDEALTRHLFDPEARVLVEWLADEAEKLSDSVPPENLVPRVRALCRLGRSMARFVKLYCHDGLPEAAFQLAASENRDWPLPTAPMDPDLLIQRLIWSESGSAS